MTALAELKKLPLSERLQLVEDLWDSIAEEHHALPDSPELVAEIRARSANLKANPSSGLSWDEMKTRISSQRG